MTDQAATARRHGSSFWARVAATTAFVAVAGATVIGVHAQGMRGHGPGGPERMLFGGPPEHVSRVVDHMLDGLNATDAQRTQIKQIATAAAADLKAQHSGDRALRLQAEQIFTAPVVDARAAETVRQQLSAQHDLASKRVLQAMLDISQVLTPDQRVQLAQRQHQRRAAMFDRMKRDGAASRPQ